MFISSREKIIAIVAAAVLCLLGLDHYVLSPAIERYRSLRDEKLELSSKLSDAQNLVKRRHLLEKKLAGMVSSGLADDAARAENIVLHSLQKWADECSVALNSLTPERKSDPQKVGEIVFSASGTGRLESAVSFLWNIESSEMPIRIVDMHISSRNENSDMISIQLRVSAIYLVDDPAEAGADGGNEQDPESNISGGLAARRS